MFLVEGNSAARGSGLAGVYSNDNLYRDTDGMVLDGTPASIVGAGVSSPLLTNTRSGIEP